MQRKEQHRGGSPAGAGRQSEARDEACEGEPGSVVQRTQVVLLAGEPWGADGGQKVLSSFAHHVLPPTGAGGTSLAHRDPAAAPGEPGAEEQQLQHRRPPPHPPSEEPAAPSGQLTFFLCRAASLRERAERLREVLQGVRDQSRGAPAALVGVIVQPRPEEEKEALLRLEGLLREVFEAEGAAAPMEIHTAVFAPGRPDGALELRRVTSRVSAQQSVSAIWKDKSLFIQVLGALLSFGTVAYGGYYFYHHPPM